MNTTTRILLRVLNKQQMLKKLRDHKKLELAARKAELHTRYVAYHAKQDEHDDDLPWV